ncbi:MAG TPA: phage holin family protein [Cryobacterium sp.]|nr:phage holin family protein [Cryobacterium sp.]
MIRFLIRTAIFLGSAALGLWVASLVLDGFTLTWQGFLVTVLVFAAAQSVLAPFIAKLAARNAPAFLGGVGLVSTFVALLIASVVANGLVITGWQSWILATLVVWLVTAVATVTLPLLFLRKVRQKGSDRT